MSDKKSLLDEHGQPIVRAFNSKRLSERSLDELIGICKGCQADGIVNQYEAEFLQLWLKQHEHVLDQWPANVLAVRLFEYLEDGRLDKDEADELLQLLRATVGGNEGIYEIMPSTTLAFDNPLPHLDFDGEAYCLTGEFAFGPRKAVENEIISLGGRIASAPLKTNRCIVVVGLFASREWIHSTFGRKIEKALQLRNEGCPVSIVPEDHWTEQLASILGM